MRRKIYAVILTVVMAAMMMVACGKDVSKMDNDELYAYLMDMDEDKREAFIEKLDDDQQDRAYAVLFLNEMAGDSDDENAQEVQASETKEETGESKNTTYAPTDEIINSSLSDMKIQIGNSVFQNGGFITLGDFVEKYSDEFVCERLNVDEFLTRTAAGVPFKSVNDGNMKLWVRYVCPTGKTPDDHVKLSEAVVTCVKPWNKYTAQNTFYAQGVPSMNTGYTWENYNEYYEGNGLQQSDDYPGDDATGYWDWSDGHMARVCNDSANLLGDRAYAIYLMQENGSTGEIYYLCFYGVYICDGEEQVYFTDNLRYWD